MKKAALFFVLTICFCMSVYADNNDKEAVKLTIKLKDQNGENDEIPRAPVRVPSLFIEEHTLTFTSSCVGCTLQLWHEGILVYTYDILDTDDVVLPSDLTGEYEIRLLRGAFTFVGTIEL